jgi:hypothetical protein
VLGLLSAVTLRRLPAKGARSALLTRDQAPDLAANGFDRLATHDVPHRRKRAQAKRFAWHVLRGATSFMFQRL